MPRKTKEIQELKETKKTSKSASKASTSTTKKVSSKNSTKAKTINSKKEKVSTAKKTTSTRKKTSKSTKNKVNPIITEYYDLPEKYNQTIVKVLAQTPKTLFIYWEISNDDIQNYKNQYGENFFEITRPVLIVHNNTLNYSFEVEINDFANSWYLHINDSKSDYSVELGRRPINHNSNLKADYLYITKSNKIESPNDHILFNNSQKMVYFRNVTTKQEFKKPISSISFMRNMGKIYDIYDIYKELYKNEEDFNNLSNPSSHTSSQFK